MAPNDFFNGLLGEPRAYCSKKVTDRFALVVTSESMTISWTSVMISWERASWKSTRLTTARAVKGSSFATTLVNSIVPE